MRKRPREASQLSPGATPSGSKTSTTHGRFELQSLVLSWLGATTALSTDMASFSSSLSPSLEQASEPTQAETMSAIRATVRVPLTPASRGVTQLAPKTDNILSIFGSLSKLPLSNGRAERFRDQTRGDAFEKCPDSPRSACE
jgi:hypothetical protein